MVMVTPRFFRSGAEFRRWLAKHHATSRELLVGFHRVATGLGGLGYRDALDAALEDLIDDCEMELVFAGERWTGKDGAREFYAKFLAAFEAARYLS